MAVLPDLRLLLKLGGFRRLLAVRLLSQAADGVFQVGLATYVVFSPEKQATPGQIASAMAVLLLPYSLVGPFAGVFLDRWRRRQVFLYGSLLRVLLASATAVLILARIPDGLFYGAALCVTAVNRFVLAGLSAALPRVVDGPRLVVANALSPTAGTLAATAGGGLAFLVRLLGWDSDAAVLLLGAALYLAAALASLRIPVDALGPSVEERPRAHVRAALAASAQGLLQGLRHLADPARRPAARSLAAMALLRFCYGALTVTVLMLCRYAWSTTEEDGLALLGLALGLSAAGFFVAALLSPWAIRRFGALGWIAGCAALAAVLVGLAGPFFAEPLMMALAFFLGVVTQGAKIATDTVVQSEVEDAYRGRVFSVYDVLFNVAFVAAAGASALVLPGDGRSVALVLGVAVIYAGVAALAGRALRVPARAS
ncbi:MULTISPECIES: MFS transporter [unclassified Streptomyces]|uniref:MFS transporter n=1 Tax=unclassified Streptomyces TaxID=2593676 RepID=UPI00081D4769|nr:MULTISPECIES: MFS transporter [unclassified Streptomyces]MYR27393.1 MFS transporter [Streptomyces sp. SID4945]SCD56640.1 Major Facilitator Superfamily protein [Streptomyces sp. TverLS-915]SCF22912.1 Major Facilitator Superfamily protein [Streptomyces sp. LcepLS]